MVERRDIIAAFLIAFTVAGAGKVDGRTVYKTVDAEGRTVYSDRPPSNPAGRAVERLEVPVGDSVTPSAQPGVAEAEGAEPAPAGVQTQSIEEGSEGSDPGSAADSSPLSGGPAGVGSAGGGGGGSGGGGSSASSASGSGPAGGGAVDRGQVPPTSPVAPTPAPVSPAAPALPTGGTATRDGQGVPGTQPVPPPPPVASTDTTTVIDVSGDDPPPPDEPPPAAPAPAPAVLPGAPPQAPVVDSSPVSPAPAPAPATPLTFDPAPQGQSCDAADTVRISPVDVRYLGAIRVPVENSSSRGRLGGAMGVIAYRPDGDAGGEDDGFPGSLYMAGHRNDSKVFEFTIPAPSITPPYPRAEGLRVGSVMGTLCQQFNGPDYLGGMLVVDDQIIWTCRQYYNVSPEPRAVLGSTNLSLTTQRHLGLVAGGRIHSNQWAGYITRLPDEWCSKYTADRCLASGLSGVPGRSSGSSGPGLMAWSLSDIESITRLVHYPYHGGHDPAGWTSGDQWFGAAWVKTSEGQSMVFGGRVSNNGRPAGQECCYGKPEYCSAQLGIPVGRLANSGKGYHCDPYKPVLRFYDANDLAGVATGALDTNRAVAYAEIDLTSTFEANGRWYDHIVAGAAFDGKHLYVVQHRGDETSATYLPYPLIHVYSIPGEACP